jgi:hypothetical protein
MTIQLFPEASDKEPDPAEQTRGPGAVDVGSRKWQRRVASIQENPARSVVVGCGVLYLLTMITLVVNFIIERRPLFDAVYILAIASVSVAAFYVAIGLIVYPVVYFCRFQFVGFRNRKFNDKKIGHDVEQISARNVTINQDQHIWQPRTDVSQAEGRQ